MRPVEEACLVLLLAALVDAFAGEPAARLHPVVWIGALAKRLTGGEPGAPAVAFVRGLVVALGIPLLAAAAAAAAVRLLDPWPVARIAVAVFVVKGASSLRMLARAAAAVGAALAAADLDGARTALRSLVSRDTGRLGPPLLAAAAIESAAENGSDSWVAPLFFYTVGAVAFDGAGGGAACALAYRAVNTLDSMIGYRGRTEWLGKAAARLDDVLNLVPARLTALLVVVAAALAAPWVGSSPARALAIALRDHAVTASPNAGWPMAAMAGALGVELEKVDHYVLFRGARDPGPPDVRRAVILLRIVGGLTLAGAAAVLLAVGARR